jgi:hypothetical protein
MPKTRWRHYAPGTPPPSPQPPTTDTPAAGTRPPEIARLVSNLQRRLKSMDTMTPDELLQVERDFYITDAWIEFVEPALERDPKRFAEFAPDLLLCLLRNPTSRHAQLSLALIRAFVTPTEIQAALTREHAYLECNPRLNTSSLSIAALCSTIPVWPRFRQRAGLCFTAGNSTTARRRREISSVANTTSCRARDGVGEPKPLTRER